MGGVFGKCFHSSGSDQSIGKKKKKEAKEAEQKAAEEAKVKQAAKNRVNDQDKAILDVKTRMKKIKTYVDKMKLQVEEQDKKIKDLVKAKQKERAVIALKHRKFLDKELEKAEGAQQMLQQTLNNIESAQMDVEVYEALKQGDSVITELQKKASLEDFEALYERHQEQKERMEMEQEMFGQAFNDDDLLNELEALDAEEQIPSANQELIEGDYQIKRPQEKAQEEEGEAQSEKRELVAA